MIKYENIIIGAGPAGLQLGYFFQKANINYIIIEKGKKSATFFSKYPHTGTLISINKKYTGNDNKDFNLRHDWNSLLNEEDLLFTNYSDEYYPSNKDLVRYLNDFAVKNKLNIVYNSNVIKVNKNEENYDLEVIENENQLQYSCNKLIIATGLSKVNKPDWDYNVKQPILHYGEYPKNYFKKKENLEKFKNKSLLIIGNGNCGFELGNHLNKYCSKIHIVGRNQWNWALTTHYTGDIRGVYLQFFDTFLLKSLNSISWDKIYKIIFKQENEYDKYSAHRICTKECATLHSLLRDMQDKFDHIIICTGWKFDNSIYNFDVATTSNDKYPAINYDFQSINNKNLYFIGSLMHSLDLKKSSGGFIHGFRYLIQHFFNLNYTKIYNINNFSNVNSLIDHILYKINTSSALYQMYGELSDIFFLDNNKNYFYINNVPKNFLKTHLLKIPNKIYFVLTLEYGKDLVTDITKIGKKVSSLGFENKSPLLHLIINIVTITNDLLVIKLDEVHFDEDIRAEFLLDHLYKDKILRTIKMFIDIS
jgi:hypothetical protein